MQGTGTGASYEGSASEHGQCPQDALTKGRELGEAPRARVSPGQQEVGAAIAGTEGGRRKHPASDTLRLQWL